MVEATFCAAQVTAGLKEGAALFVFSMALSHSITLRRISRRIFTNGRTRPRNAAAFAFQLHSLLGLVMFHTRSIWLISVPRSVNRLPAPVSGHASGSDFQNKGRIEAGLRFGWITSRICNYTSRADIEIGTMVNMTVNPQCRSTFRNKRFEVRRVRWI